MWEKCKELQEELVRMRRELHQIPELGELPKTRAYVEEKLKELGIPFVENKTDSGLIATIKGEKEGKTIVLRADMDALPIQEANEVDYISRHEGCMHACGHDGHTALGLSLARWIGENKDELCGSFVLIFQPAEEGTRGAAPIAAKGWVDDVDYFFAGHCGMYCQKGEIGICSGGFFATSKLDIRFTGVPSHAGAFPERGRSALSAACSAVMMMQGISRTSQGDSRISIGKLTAGEGRNVTPVHALIQLETRGETEEVNEFLVNNVRNIVKGAAEAYETKYEIKIVGHATSLMTTPKGVELLKKTASLVEGYGKVRTFDRVGGSEDATVLFKRAVEHGADGAFFMWGVNNQGHHKPDFDLQDVETMPPAILFCQNLVKQTNGINKN